jgi:hypothetical protein
MYHDAMLLQLGNIKKQAAGGLAKMHTPYGDWCPPPAVMGKGQGPKPSKPYTSAFNYVVMAQELAELAQAMGNSSEHDEMAKLAADLTAEFNAAFANSTSGIYDVNVMTDYALALKIGAADGIMSPTMKQAQESLNTMVTASKNHHTTGIIGWKFLFDGLKAGGHEDTALAVLEQTTYPSIGYYFANKYEPATENLWELMDAPYEGTGMNSRNHHMWSSYSHYLVASVAGLAQQPSSSGYREVLFSPASSLGLSAAEASISLSHGDVAIQWQRHGGVQCSKAAEDRTVSLDCGEHGGVISHVEFASFGRAEGMCGRFAVDGAGCHAPSTTEIVAANCVGKRSCELRADAPTFFANSELTVEHACTADAHGKIEGLKLWAQVRCSAGVSIASRVQVPVGTKSATLHFPVALLQSQSPQSALSLHEGTTRIYEEDSQQALAHDGILTVQRDVDHAGREVLAVVTGSGSYEFLATAA